MVYLFNYGSYSLVFYAGSRFVEDKTLNHATDEAYKAGDLLAIFFSLLTGAMSLTITAPSIKAFVAAKYTAAVVYPLLDRKSKINIEDSKGEKPQSIHG